MTKADAITLNFIDGYMESAMRAFETGRIDQRMYDLIIEEALKTRQEIENKYNELPF